MTESPKQYRSPNRRHERRFFYKYVTADVAKIILATRKLRWSSPILFNDPFDVTQELRLSFDEVEFNAAVCKEFASKIEHGELSVGHPQQDNPLHFVNVAPPDERQVLADDIRQNPGALTDGQIQSHAEIKQMWREMVPTFRILCLSDCNDITPMWYNYADKYKGVVLEFEAVDAVDSCFLIAQPVKYSNKLPAISNSAEWARCLLHHQHALYKDIFIQSLYEKNQDWSYEHEWRLHTFKADNECGLFTDYGFHPRELSGIYFGLNCPTDETDPRKELLALLAHGFGHTQAYQAVLDGPESKFNFRHIS